MAVRRGALTLWSPASYRKSFGFPSTGTRREVFFAVSSAALAAVSDKSSKHVKGMIFEEKACLYNFILLILNALWNFRGVLNLNRIVHSVRLTYERVDMFYHKGQRKSLSAAERIQFYEAARERWDLKRFTFCLFLLDTGCRISEALQLRVQDIDFAAGMVAINTLKQRKNDVYRVVPIFPELLEHLHYVIDAGDLSLSQRLWPHCRTTGYDWVKKAMNHARLTGIKATPTGLRHGFCVACGEVGSSDSRTQKLMGHAKIQTTQHYMNFIDTEIHTIVNKTLARPQKG